mgnify:CR=1 FL=1
MSENQLRNNIALLKKEALRTNQKLIYNFTGDGGSVVIANKDVGSVGLIALAKNGSTLAYNVNIGKWSWAKEEGFSVKEMSSEPALREEIFEPTPMNKLIKSIIFTDINSFDPKNNLKRYSYEALTDHGNSFFFDVTNLYELSKLVLDYCFHAIFAPNVNKL